MAKIAVKNSTVTSRVSANMVKKAKGNLAEQGLSISEYIRMAVYKAANSEVSVIDFLDTPEACQAKKNIKNNRITKVGNLKALDKWMDSL